jgi:hypothetical protein
MNQRSPRGERQRPVHAGGSAQWVAWRLWSYTIAQYRPASEMKPGRHRRRWASWRCCPSTLDSSHGPGHLRAYDPTVRLVAECWFRE